MQNNSGKQKLLITGAIFAYLLIGIEIIIMISPFALYFYSVYAPVLEFFSNTPVLRWTTEFFLPHMVFVNDPLILGISYLQILLVIGLLLFFSAAIPLYYGRFTGKGVVMIGLYSKIRHPQYLFLAISGFGLLLYWPRFIILITYISMLFVYYILARNEEWRMKMEVPEAYEEYMKGTPMFLPGEPGGRIYDIFLGRLKPKWLGILVLYVVTLLVSVLLAVGIRQYTISQLPAVEMHDMMAVPVFERDPAEIRNIYNNLREEPLVRKAVEKSEANLVYVLPGDFFLTALVTDEDRRFSQEMIERFPEVLEWHQHKFSGGLGKFFRIFYNFFKKLGKVETDYAVERLVFVRVADFEGEPVTKKRIFEMGWERAPVLIVDIDSFTREILTIISPSGKNKWGEVPMPTF